MLLRRQTLCIVINCWQTATRTAYKQKLANRASYIDCVDMFVRMTG